MIERSPNIAVAVLHSFESEDQETYINRRRPLAEAFGAMGVNLVLLNGAKDRLNDEQGGFSRHYTLSADQLHRHDDPIRIDSAYDLSGGIGRFVSEVPALNPNSVREVVLSKASQYSALESLDGAIAKTVSVPAVRSAVLEAMDAFDGNKLILKTEKASKKQHAMLVGTKTEIEAGLDELIAPMDNVLIQEYMDEVHTDFPKDLQFANQQERELQNATRGLGRELRVYTLDRKPVLTTARVGLDPVNKSPLDDWLYLDNQQIPERITDLAARASSKIMEKAGDAQDAYLAVDLTPDGSRIIEVNGRNIGTMLHDPDRPASLYAQERTTQAVARKLYAMSQRSGGK